MKSLQRWAAGTLVLLSACGGAGEAGPLNVVLISIDSLRQDRLGCYGHRPEFAPEQHVSPNIDALAERGVVFEAAWSSSSWTLPAHMSLLTGLSAAAHVVETDHQRLDPHRTTLAEGFRAAGWATAGVYSGPYLDSRHGFDRGFERYESAMLTAQQVEERVESERARRAAAGEQAPSASEERVFRQRVPHWDVTSPGVTERGERFIEEHAAVPFFLFLHYFDVHYDYVPDAASPGLAQRFDPGYAGAFDGRYWYFDARVRELQPPFERRIGARDLAHVEALYDAEIQWVDHHVGRVLGKLNALGLADRTIVAVVADHGDEFFEHDSIGHRNTLFTEVTRIPLVLVLPNGQQAGRRVATPVRIQDLAATLLDYAGAPALPESEGPSLRALLDGLEPEPRAAFSRLYDPTPWFVNVRESWRDPRYTVVRHFVIDEETKALEQTRDPKTGELIFHVFDCSADPLERAALRPHDPRYREAVDLYRRAWAAAQPFLDALPRSPPSSCLIPNEDSTQRARLEALGYFAQDSELEPALPRLTLAAPWD